jgi:hypothetical protein
VWAEDAAGAMVSDRKEVKVRRKADGKPFVADIVVR